MVRFLLLSLCLIWVPVVHAQTYILGVVPQQSPITLYKSWLPVITYLKDHTGLDIQFRTEKSIQDFEEKLYAGEYDLAYVNPYHYVIANRQQGYQARLRRSGKIRGVLVALKGAKTDLINANSLFLFPSANAFAATLIMKYEMLVQFGLDLEKTKNYQYVNSHDSVYKGVSRGVGQLGGGVERTFESFTSEEDKAKLEVLYTTQAYPSHPLVFKPSMPERDQQEIVDALLSMPTELLETLSMKQLIQTQDDEYDSVRVMTDRLATVAR